MDEYIENRPISELAPSEQATFIRQVYTHLAGAVAAFIILEYALLNSPFAHTMLSLVRSNKFVWLGVLAAFSVVGWLARSFAQNARSSTTQYIGLGLYVVAEAVIFVPLLSIATMFSKSVLPTAAIMTGAIFLGLTMVVFITKRDFSFLRMALTVGGFVALGLIVCSITFGFNLGVIFSGVMIILASAAILYDTSNVLHHYSGDQYISASLELFASLALLFWYVVSFLMDHFGDDD